MNLSNLLTVMTQNLPADPPPAKSFTTETILTNVIAFLSPVVGIAIVVFCVIQAFKLFKGAEGASVKKLLIGVGILFLLLGIMALAGSFDTIATLFKDVVNTAVSKGTGDATNMLG